MKNFDSLKFKIPSNKSSDLDSGIYHWNIREHALELLQRGNFGLKLSSAALDQTMVAKSPAVVVWAAVFSRSKWKYHERAYRYIFMDVGHIAAQLTLGAVSLGWGTCQIGAFYDNEVNKLLNLDGIQESVVYMTVLGKI
ncbi:MAG: SagB/ThcOx family dehydrogenase [Candidatus Lokiarchaeota archaeon]|nr:SagB/ThcOx family dehydrogenase [Candidatus Harpocratesius repetitus]